MSHYDEALASTVPVKGALMVPGSVEETDALERFKAFYAVFSRERIESMAGGVYAENAYFRDGIREVRGLPEIQSYFISSTEAIELCVFDIEDGVGRRGEYYFRWVMHLTLKRNKDETIVAPGMSHVRFNGEGKVIFHQDYWDTSLILEPVPVLGSLIRWIKRRI
ncbi:nuclear transport factor 2 family protein [Desulfoluna sp.]|uniref:nuclear transport factor 2 family protein n=1 Tax=Desulfoluna sp. TaxID=2045199 RepID=UPI0026137E4F|nr:nuclear transport factor 2 family protein [Desulfoluna sp.]